MLYKLNTNALERGHNQGVNTMQTNHLTAHFDKTYTFGGFSVGLQIDEYEGTSNADLFIIKDGKLYKCNFAEVDGFSGDIRPVLDSGYDISRKPLYAGVREKLTDWLYENGY